MLWPGWERHLVVGAMTLYPVLLFWTYRYTISPSSSGRGYVYDNPDSFAPVVTAFLLAIVPALMLPIGARRPGTVILWALYLIAYVPSQILPPMTIDVTSWQLLQLQVALAAGFGILLVANAMPTSKLPPSPFPARWFWPALFGATIVMLAAVIWFLGLPRSLPSFGEVYDVRATFLSNRDTAPFPIAYVWGWLGQVIFPLLIVIGVIRRRALPLLAGIGGQVLLYGMSGAKTLLFSIALAVVLYGVLLLAREYLGVLCSAGACVLVVGSSALDRLLDTPWFTALLVQRILVTPGLLTGFYYDFFISHEKTMLSQSVLTPFFDYPYDTSVAYLIGERYLNSPTTMANANIWADGYANLGVTGVLLVSLVAGAVIWAFNGLNRRHGVLLTGALVGSVSFSLANSAIFTALLTHGIALLLGVLWLMPSQQSPAESRSESTA